MTALERRVQLPCQAPPVDAGTDAACVVDFQRGFVDGRIVAAVPIEDEEAAGAVLHQRKGDAVQQVVQSFIADVDAAGKAHVVGTHPIRDRWSDDKVGQCLYLSGKVVRNQEVGAKRALRSVLLTASHRQQDDRVQPERLSCLLGGHFCKKHKKRILSI